MKHAFMVLIRPGLLVGCVLAAGCSSKSSIKSLNPTTTKVRIVEGQSPSEEQLTKFYPNDETTGFKEGELRGWFWIDLPKG